MKADGSCTKLDAAGKQVKRFVSGQDGSTGCGIDFTPKGRILVGNLRQNGVEEFDLQGKRLWQTSVTTNGTAVRNAHVMTVHWTNSYVAELDRAGRVVWQYRVPGGYQPFRARKR